MSMERLRITMDPEPGKCEPCEVEPVIGRLPVPAGRVVPKVEQV